MHLLLARQIYDFLARRVVNNFVSHLNQYVIKKVVQTPFL